MSWSLAFFAIRSIPVSHSLSLPGRGFNPLLSDFSALILANGRCWWESAAAVFALGVQCLQDRPTVVLLLPWLWSLNAGNTACSFCYSGREWSHYLLLLTSGFPYCSLLTSQLFRLLYIQCWVLGSLFFKHLEWFLVPLLGRPLLIQSISVISLLAEESFNKAGCNRNRREGETCQRRKGQSSDSLEGKGDGQEKSGSLDNGDCQGWV